MSAYQFQEWTMRADMVDAVKRYVNDRLPPGDFLAAVICNNLSEAIGRADMDNMRNIPAIAAYFYNEVPTSAWGSKEKMQAWLHPSPREVTP